MLIFQAVNSHVCLTPDALCMEYVPTFTINPSTCSVEGVKGGSSGPKLALKKIEI